MCDDDGCEFSRVDKDALAAAGIVIESNFMTHLHSSSQSVGSTRRLKFRHNFSMFTQQFGLHFVIFQRRGAGYTPQIILNKIITITVRTTTRHNYCVRALITLRINLCIFGLSSRTADPAPSATPARTPARNSRSACSTCSHAPPVLFEAVKRPSNNVKLVSSLFSPSLVTQPAHSPPQC